MTWDSTENVQQLVVEHEVALSRLEVLLERERAVLAGLRAALEDAVRRAGVLLEGPRASVGSSAEELHGMDAVEAAAKLAADNRNILHVTSARKELVKAGVVPEGRAGITMFSRAIRNSEFFEPIEGRRGRYRLFVEPSKPDERRPAFHDAYGSVIPTRVPHSSINRANHLRVRVG